MISWAPKAQLRSVQKLCPSHLSAGEDVPGQFDLGEVALADGLEQSVVADVGLLRLLRAAGSHAGPGRARADLLTPITVRRVLWKRHYFRRELVVELFLLWNISHVSAVTHVDPQWHIHLGSAGRNSDIYSSASRQGKFFFHQPQMVDKICIFHHFINQISETLKTEEDITLIVGTFYPTSNFFGTLSLRRYFCNLSNTWRLTD